MAPPDNCGECAAPLDSGALSCPACHRLVHSLDLKRLADEARAREQEGDYSAALAAWRTTQDLLPAESRQHAVVSDRIRTLSDRVSGAAPAPPRSGLARAAAGAGALALLLWKIKWVLGFLLTKGKLVLAGLTKLPTLLSMFLYFAVFWDVWGWRFALGIVFSLYLHEMGHIVELRRFGIAATAPMFIPGLGAFVRLKQYPATPREDSRVGLAGPIWGLGAAGVAWLIFLASGEALFGAVARMGAWINVLNLIPVWQLDGGRGFRSLSSRQRWLAAAAAGAAWFLSGETMLLVVAIASVFRCFGRGAPAESDRVALAQWIALVAGLGALCTVPVPLPGR
jgi:Zn-dependent protease